MESFRKVTGVAAPMLRINIDTDQIIPALFLGGTDAKGYGANLFHGQRFRADGSPNPDFVLNQPPYNQAQVLLADRNFGCGSSRERAPKALREFGFRAIVAPSYGGIFFNNCFRNGLLPVSPSGHRYHFEAPETLRQMLLQGMDEIAMTLARLGEINAYRAKDKARRPWAY